MPVSSRTRSNDGIIITVTSPAAFYAGMVAKYAIEHWTRVPVEVELASEFRYRDPILDYSTLVVAVGRSGETADTCRRSGTRAPEQSKVLADVQHERLDHPA